MKAYFFEWLPSLKMNDYLIMNGGVGPVLSWEIHRLAKANDIQISELKISPVGVSLLANKNPQGVIYGGEYKLRLVNVALRDVEGALLTESKPLTAA